MDSSRRKSFNFQGFEMRKTSPAVQKRFSADFSTPPPKKARQFSLAGGGAKPAAAVYTPPFPSPLARISGDLFSSPQTPESPRILFKTKDCEECRICSNELFEVRHPHISTQETVTRNNTPEYYCSICRRKHGNKNLDGGRMNIVLSSSTLHNLWKVNTYRPGAHIDFDCIIGGRIHDVHASFLYQYAGLRCPLDVVLACGVNNIPTEDTADAIILQFQSFVNTIKQHSADNGHTKPSRVVISTIHFAPKYSDPSLRPQDNQIDKVRKVNAWIHEFNSKETGEHLDLHLYGVQGDPHSGPVVHKYDDWREPDKFRKLHFNNFVKARIATELVSIFSNLQRKL